MDGDTGVGDGHAGEDLPARVVGLLRAVGGTVGVAESLTGGLVTAALTSVAGAGAVVRGGLVVYATDLKARLAGVDPDLLARHGAVHPEVAGALATGARRVTGADWGLGLTGVAGPDPQDGRSPGTVFIAVAGPGRAPVTRGLTLSGDRGAVRRGAVTGVLGLLESGLREHS